MGFKLALRQRSIPTYISELHELISYLDYPFNSNDLFNRLCDTTSDGRKYLKR